MWDVLRDQAVSAPVRRASAEEFERVLGLDLLAGTAEPGGQTVEIGGYKVRFLNAAAGVDLQDVAAKVSARAAARKARDFGAADRLRGELAGLGVSVKDMADGGAECRFGA
jgi:cysteinyl-tRNA synthetase